MSRVHASCIAVEGVGVLLRGPSGSGKSDLALRLIDGGATLVADDQVLLTRNGERLVASAPETIAGAIEVRGLGICTMPHADAVVGVVVDLVPAGDVERMPAEARIRLEGVVLPRIALSAFEASAPAKVRLAVRRSGTDINAAISAASPRAGLARS